LLHLYERISGTAFRPLAIIACAYPRISANALVQPQKNSYSLAGSVRCDVRSSNRGRHGLLRKNDDGAQRGGKLEAHIEVALLLLTFSIVFFGPIGGTIAFIILAAALLGVDYLIPNDE
jgi:hypothetical protein